MLVVVCLLLINVLVRQIGKEPALRLLGLNQARFVSLGEHPSASSRERHNPRDVEAVVSSSAPAMSGPHARVQVDWHHFGPERANRPAFIPPSEAHPQAIDQAQAKTMTLEPLGYAEKSDGRVEAIISVGEHVQVVHEGEILEDNFRVARISSSAVELVPNSALAAESHLQAEKGQGVAQGPVSAARPTPPAPVPHVLSNLGANRPSAADSSANLSQPSVGQALGYVERSDGKVEAIVAEGEGVRLAQATKSFANSFHGPAPTPANLEVANASPPPTNPPDLSDNESQPLQTDSSTQQAEAPPLVASGSEPSTAGTTQGIRGDNGESGQLGITQPEPLADYSSGRCGKGTPACGGGAGTLACGGGAGTLACGGGAGTPACGGGTGTPACVGGDKALVPHVAPPSAAPPLFSNGTETQSAINALGYVEKAGGEKEAIVEVYGEVYLVHAGELFAERYRALKVTSSSVEIVEESPAGVSPPAKPERGTKAVRPRIPQ